VAFSHSINFLPSATITLISVVGYTNRFNFFATFISMKLWVLPVSTRMVTFSFFMCPFSFNVCGCVILVIAARDILGITSSGSVLGESSSSLPSLSESLSDVSDSFSASQVYSFLLLNLCPGDHLSPQFLHLFPHLLSGSCCPLSPSLNGGGIYLLDMFVEYLFEFPFRYLFDLSGLVNDGLLNLVFCSITLLCV
jgi:hypothetical protein